MSTYYIPEKLVVKCTSDMDYEAQEITFNSVDNCSYELVKDKIDECFSLHNRAYQIAYEDDDREEHHITTDESLADAIEFFKSGSSNDSAYSGRSTRHLVILVVHIKLEYDGPALSDYTSLSGVDGHHNAGQPSLISPPRPAYEAHAAAPTSEFRTHDGEMPEQGPLADGGSSAPVFSYIGPPSDGADMQIQGHSEDLGILTSCSSCRLFLADIRYICWTCQEKTPEDTQSGSDVSGSYLQSSLNGPSSMLVGESNACGFELCVHCIEAKGVAHARSTSQTPSSEDRDDRSLRQTSPRGRLRHAFITKYLNANRWEYTEQDEAGVSLCSFCHITINGDNTRYKCFSCENISACRSCYSLIHELHPHHTFLVVPECSTFERLKFKSTLPNPENDHSLLHPNTSCHHCMLEIIGARYNCVVCPSVDICQTCESAGMPGDLDTGVDGHNSTHYLLKIPRPVPSSELGSLRQRAYEASLRRTGLGFNTKSIDDHRISCDDCGKRIVGIRYQCASCEEAYNLCEGCEETSYLVHDPMHVFFKIPRPVLRPLETPLVPPVYRVAAGPPTSSIPNDPKAYLETLQHAALCDLCVTHIKGEWYRCGNCSRDLCGSCQEMDMHNDTHIFLVLKSTVDLSIFKDTLYNKTIIPYPVYAN